MLFDFTSAFQPDEELAAADDWWRPLDEYLATAAGEEWLATMGEQASCAAYNRGSEDR